jgi:hypothetical protein
MKRTWVLIALLILTLSGCTFSINVGSDPTNTGLPGCRAATTSGRDENRSGLLLMAQAVPTASLLPCIRTLPVGWKFGNLEAMNGRGRFWLDSDRAGARALRVSVTNRCDVGSASETASPWPGVRRFERIDISDARYSADWFFLYSGGCVQYQFNMRGPSSEDEVRAVSTALDFAKRTDLARSVSDYSHGRLTLDPPSSTGRRR